MTALRPDLYDHEFVRGQDTALIMANIVNLFLRAVFFWKTCIDQRAQSRADSVKFYLYIAPKYFKYIQI